MNYFMNNDLSTDCNINFPCGPINTITERVFRPISDINFFPKPVFIMTLHVIGKFVTEYHLLIQSTLYECILEACTCTTHCTKHWTTTRHVVLFPKLKLCSGNAMVVLNFIIPTYNIMSIKFSCVIVSTFKNLLQEKTLKKSDTFRENTAKSDSYTCKASILSNYKITVVLYLDIAKNIHVHEYRCP